MASEAEADQADQQNTGTFRQNTSDTSAQKTSSDSEYEPTEGNETAVEARSDARLKRRRYHRHTAQQIQEMEAFFRECPHPDDKQRRELSRVLELEPLQVKFWFQNKRTQVKTHQERHNNAVLRAEIDKLRTEVESYKEALNNGTCRNCGPGPAPIGEMSFDEHQLRVENARLREEVDRLSGMVGNHGGIPVAFYNNLSSQKQMASHNYGAQSSMVGDIYGAVAERENIAGLAAEAMEELIQMALAETPLWIPGIHGTDILNQEEYAQSFHGGTDTKLVGLRCEASRDTVVVAMNHTNLVEIFMDVHQWSKVFCGIVSRAMTHEILTTGLAGNYDGALQVMSAEFQVPSPFVLTRDNYFARHCKLQTDGTWVVVDISLENVRPTTISRSRRRASGCLIRELSNGYSKVIWVEHVDADDRTVHNLYKCLVNSGLAFGAKRWVGALYRQCQRLASTLTTNISAADRFDGVITGPEGRRGMLRLAERMMASFCTGVGSSTAHSWTPLAPTCEDVRVMTRKIMHDPGRPPGLVLSAATSFWLPIPPKAVFDFLQDGNSRNQWDSLSNGCVIQEMEHISNGHDPGNCVSLLRVLSGSSNHTNMLILQESCTDATGSYVVYAPIDSNAMNVVFNGGDPDYIGMLPSGFAILPDGPGPNGGSILDVGSGGCLLTVAFQILVDSVPTANLSARSVSTVNSLLKCTVEKIRAAVSQGLQY